jgi:CMP/dCMP kinase
MLITISGTAGSGKSTLAKNLAKALGVKHYSAGDFTREIAKEKGITIHELQELEAKDPSIDLLVDAKTKEVADKHENAVIDGWLGFHFLPKSIKIFVKCNNDEAARRIYEAQREEEKHNTTLEETKKRMLRRIEVNRERWIRYYNTDILEEKNYDFLIDTTHSSKEESLQTALEYIEKQKH